MSMYLSHFAPTHPSHSVHFHPSCLILPMLVTPRVHWAVSFCSCLSTCPILHLPTHPLWLCSFAPLSHSTYVHHAPCPSNSIILPKSLSHSAHFRLHVPFYPCPFSHLFCPCSSIGFIFPRSVNFFSSVHCSLYPFIPHCPWITLYLSVHCYFHHALFSLLPTSPTCLLLAMISTSPDSVHCYPVCLPDFTLCIAIPFSYSARICHFVIITACLECRFWQTFWLFPHLVGDLIAASSSMLEFHWTITL